MTKRSYVRLYGDHGGELDAEQIIGGAVAAALQQLIDRVTFAPGDVIKIEQYEEAE